MQLYIHNKIRIHEEETYLRVQDLKENRTNMQGLEDLTGLVNTAEDQDQETTRQNKRHKQNLTDIHTCMDFTDHLTCIFTTNNLKKA